MSIKYNEQDMDQIMQDVKAKWDTEYGELHALRFEDDSVGVITKQKVDKYGQEDENGEYSFTIFWISPRRRNGVHRVYPSTIEDGMESQYYDIGSIDEYAADKKAMLRYHPDYVYVDYKEVE